MSQYFKHPYYLSNFILCLIYPIVRYLGVSSNHLKIKDTLGFQKETQIITGVLVLIIVRYIRYFSNFKQFLAEAIFFVKAGTLLTLFFINFKLFAWYGFFCIVVFILFKIPFYEGPTNVKYLEKMEAFEQVVLKRNKNISYKDYYWVVIFYSPFSDSCRYTEELWAKLSLNLSTPALNFAKIDVDVSPEIAAKYNIIISGIYVQLPIVILFKNGEEVKRYPWNDKSGKPNKVKFYKEKEIVKYFDLEEIYYLTRDVQKPKSN